MTRGTVLFLGGLITLQALWLWALPAFQGMDEFDHAYRADSVARGHIGASTQVPDDGRGFLVRVSPDIVRAAGPSCLALDYPGPDNCRAVPGSDVGGEVLVASAAATYNPAWYALVGVPARPFSGDNALLAMRIVSAALCDLLLVASLWCRRRTGSAHTATLGVGIACAPVVLLATVTAAPNGAEICSAILFWSGLLALPRAADAVAPRGVFAAIGVGAAGMAAFHTTGLLWIVLTLVCGATLWWPRLRIAWTTQRSQLLLLISWITLSSAACASWIIASGTNDPSSERAVYGAMPTSHVLGDPLLWLFQSVAILRMRNQAAPLTTYAVALSGLVVMLGYAVRRATRAERWSMSITLLAGTVVPLALAWLAYPNLGPAWQGRYGLPLTIGIVLVGAEVCRRQLAISQVGALAIWTAVVAAQIITIRELRRTEVLTGFAEASSTGHDLVVVVLGGLMAVALFTFSSRSTGTRVEP